MTHSPEQIPGWVKEDNRLWCLHVSGSDDVHPAPDRATAQLWAARYTAMMQERNPAPHPYDPVTNFTVQEWPWSAEAHAEGLERSIAENTPPTSRSEEAVPGIVEATRLRDEMIGVARVLADRSWGATQSEMREAQIEFLAAELAKRRAEAADHIERLTSALEGVASDCQLAIDALGNSGPEFDSVKRGLAIIRDRARDTLSLIKKQGNGHGEG